MYYCEFARDKYTRKGTMIPADVALTSGLGYCSVYQFAKEDALEIRKSNCSRGFKQYKVYSEWLWLDIDDENIAEAARRLNSLREYFNGFTTLAYFSGKKGYHLGVKIEPMYGLHVPYSQKKWIRDNNIDTDESLYQHGRLFRNPGALHESTGRRKTLLYTTEGDTLTIPLVIEPAKRIPPAEFSDDYTESDIFRDNLLKVLSIVESPPRQGMRHTTLWGFACDMLNCGASYTLTLELALYINNTFPLPKDYKDVELAVNQAYGADTNG